MWVDEEKEEGVRRISSQKVFLALPRHCCLFVVFRFWRARACMDFKNIAKKTLRRRSQSSNTYERQERTKV